MNPRHITEEEKREKAAREEQIARDLNEVWDRPGFQYVLDYIRKQMNNADSLTKVPTSSADAIIQSVLERKARHSAYNSLLTKLGKARKINKEDSHGNG